MTSEQNVNGISLRFPCTAQSPEAFTAFLKCGTDGVKQIPLSRWDFEAYFDPYGEDDGKSYAIHGAFIEASDLFDNSSFRISPSEAYEMDPHQRLLLEVGYDALKAGGFKKGHLNQRTIGVIVGISNIYWANMRLESPPGAFTGTAISGAISANRISFVQGLRGPSLAVDTACSSALVAVDMARSYSSNGSGSEFLCASCEILISPVTFILRTAAHMLSRTGRCFTFDASANGYLRGEGCSAVVLST
jgi:acyl transferase domain-containing protein